MLFQNKVNLPRQVRKTSWPPTLPGAPRKPAVEGARAEAGRDDAERTTDPTQWKRNWSPAATLAAGLALACLTCFCSVFGPTVTHEDCGALQKEDTQALQCHQHLSLVSNSFFGVICFSEFLMITVVVTVANTPKKLPTQTKGTK